MWNVELTVIPIVICALGTVTKGLVQGLEKSEIIGQVEASYRNYSSAEIDENIEKSSGGL